MRKLEAPAAPGEGMNTCFYSNEDRAVLDQLVGSYIGYCSHFTDGEGEAQGRHRGGRGRMGGARLYSSGVGLGPALWCTPLGLVLMHGGGGLIDRFMLLLGRKRFLKN